MLTNSVGGQLEEISFVDPVGFAPGTYGATLLPGTGELVPVPESAVLQWAVLPGAAALGRRRRGSEGAGGS